MPDLSSYGTITAPAAAPTDLSSYGTLAAAPEQPGFLSHLGSTITGAPAALAQTVMHPLDALKTWRDQSQELHDKAVDAAAQGDYEAAAVHGLNFLANIVPGLGKVMDEAASAKTPEEFKAKLGDVVGSALLMKAGEKAPEVIKATPGVVKAAAGKVTDFAKQPGNLDLVTGAGQVTGGGAAVLAGHPFAGGAAVMRGAENISKGIEKRASAKAAPAAAEAPAAPVTDPVLDEMAQRLGADNYASADKATQQTAEGMAAGRKLAKKPPPPVTAEPAAADLSSYGTVEQPARAAPPAASIQPRKSLVQQIDEELAARKAAAAPPEEPPPPGEAAAPAPTPPPPAAPAAPAAAAPPMPAVPDLVTPAQYEKRIAAHAADNGLTDEEAAAALDGHMQVIDRSSTNRMLHAIGAEKGYDHATLSEIAHATYGQGLGKISHEQMLELATRLGNEEPTPAEPAAAADGEPQPAGSPVGGVVAQLPVSEIHADPVRFQFKAGMGQGGAGDEFRGVTKFDPEKSGILSVWRDPADGKTYVINGHHRLEMAQRLGAKDVTVRYIDAANATEARTKGAMINIAEGRGDSLDAAKVFRDSGMGPEDLEKQGISLKGAVAKEGLALSNLDPHLFNQVVSGEIPKQRGAIIGSVAPGDQRALVDLIDKAERAGKHLTNDQIGEMIRLPAPEITETQHSLFGTEELSRSLIPEKAEVSDFVQKRLIQDKRLFTAVGNASAASRLSQAGNVIKAGENAAIAEHTSQEHALYQKLSAGAGPVNDALDAAASAIAKGENASIVKERAYAEIKSALKAQADSLTGRSSAPGERPEGHAQPGSDRSGTGQHDHDATAAQLEESIAAARKRRSRPLKVGDLMAP